jgi:hypothetical protein
MSRGAESSIPEDDFVDLFADVFGLEKAQLLVHEFAYRDVVDGQRFVDYAIKTTAGQIAFEIDGPFHYDRSLITTETSSRDTKVTQLIHAGAFGL